MEADKIQTTGNRANSTPTHSTRWRQPFCRHHHRSRGTAADLGSDAIYLLKTPCVAEADGRHHGHKHEDEHDDRRSQTEVVAAARLHRHVEGEADQDVGVPYGHGAIEDRRPAL